VRTGSADLPLHGGQVPKWLADRMTALGRVLTEAIVHHYGTAEMLRRLSHPFWFQAFGAVMGMDWHSSGITTSVLGALKRGLSPISDEIGLWVCGGRGRHSRKTPQELRELGERTGLDGAALARTSRLVAKVDSACVQDGFDLYLHGIVVDAEGRWTIVQQGMDGDRGLARRYHWLSEGVKSFVEEPHAAIDGEPRGEILNLVDARAAASRDAQVELVRSGPDAVVATLSRLRPQLELFGPQPHAILPHHHEVTAADVDLRRVHAALAAAHERGPIDFTDVIASPGIGARTMFSLALVAEIVHGAPSRFSDPARFSLAHGGKDGHPYPVPLKVFDETIRVVKRAVEAAKLGREEKLHALRKLDDASRTIDRDASVIVGPSLDAIFARERARSSMYGGRTVFGQVPSTNSGATSPSAIDGSREGSGDGERNVTGAVSSNASSSPASSRTEA
jgi:uncharacterized protein